MRAFTSAFPLHVGEGVAARASSPRPFLPHSVRRLVLTLVGFVGGAVLWTGYVFLMLRSTSWPLYVAYAGLGACCGLALVTLPRLMAHLLSKQGYRLALRQYRDRAHLLAEEARRELALPGTPSAAVHNDLGVLAFLQRRYGEAAVHLGAAQAAGLAEASVNLLATLAELGHWQELERLLPATPTTGPAADNLVRLAALAPTETLQEHLARAANGASRTRVLVNLAVRALQRGETVTARALLERALAHQPGHALALANRAVLEYQAGQLGAALQSAAAAAIAPEPMLLGNLGALLGAARQTRPAEQWLRRAERLQPRNPLWALNRGNAYHLAGRDDEALEAYASASLSGEHLVATRYGEALALWARGQRTEALEKLREAERLAPADPEVLNNLGCMHFALGHHETAQQYFQQLRRLTPDPRFVRNLIRAELGAEHLEAARELLDGLAEPPREVACERGLLHLLVALGMRPATETHRQMRDHNLRQAATAFREVLAAGHGPVLEAATNFALTAMAQGEYKLAADSFVEILRGHEGPPELNYLAGMCYVQASCREQEQHEAPDGRLAPLARELLASARPFLEQALELPTLHQTVAYDLGLVHYLLGAYPRAAEILRRVARNDSSPELLTALALALARQAQELQLQTQTGALLSEARKRQLRHDSRALLTSAIHFFRQALQSAPEAPLSHANLGLAHMLRNEAGDVEQALHHWQLMHRHGDARTRRTYEHFMQAVSPEAARRLRFQDVELRFRPVRVRDWVAFPAPCLAGPKFLIEPIPDLPQWHLEARHPAVRRCLVYRDRAERVRQKLGRLAL